MFHVEKLILTGRRKLKRRFFHLMIAVWGNLVEKQIRSIYMNLEKNQNSYFTHYLFSLTKELEVTKPERGRLLGG